MCVFLCFFLRVLMKTYWKALQHSREVDGGSEGNRKQEDGNKSIQMLTSCF